MIADETRARLRRQANNGGRGLLLAAGAAILSLGFLFGAGFYDRFLRPDPVPLPVQALDVTVCDPVSFLPGEARDPELAASIAAGDVTLDELPGQVPWNPATACNRVGTRPPAISLDDWAELTMISGQVCLDNDDPVAYDVSVKFDAVDPPFLDYVVIDTQITYQPGCNIPYIDFVWQIPAALDELVQELGEVRYRVTGLATPLDEHFLPYGWDSIPTVTITSGDR